MDENTQETNVVEKGLTFRDLLFIIRKHWIAIVCFIVACTAAGFIWSRVETPVYTSTGTMLVSYESKTTNIAQDYTFSNYISGTYVVFVKEDVVLEKVSEKLNNEFTIQQLRSNTSVKNDSLVLKITFTASNKETAKNVVQTIIETAQEVADTTETIDGAEKPVYHLLYDNLKVLSPAKDATRVSHTLRNTAIGLGVGVVLAFTYVLIRELSDHTFKSTEEIERMLNLPVLAGIPEYHFDDEKKGGK